MKNLSLQIEKIYDQISLFLFGGKKLTPPEF